MSLKFRNLVLLRKYHILLSCYNIPSDPQSLQLASTCYKKYWSSKPNMKTAGIIVIGEEILKGDVQDTNSHYAMKLLHKLGVKVKKVSIIGDNIDEIASEVKLFSKNYDYVLTTGGIGPTHDDVTFEAIAKAFNVKLAANPILVKICSKFYNTDDLKSPGMKIAFIPGTAKLTFGEDKATGQKTKYPNISIQNVYIFPGIPQLFKKSLDLLGKELFQSSAKFYGRNIYLNVNEELVVEALNKLVSKYPDVIFGSYPDMNNKDYKVKLTVESTSPEITAQAAEELIQSFLKSQIIRSDAE